MKIINFGWGLKYFSVCCLLLFGIMPRAWASDVWVSTGALPASGIRSLVMHSDRQTLYAGLMGRGVYKTEDGGATWVAANRGLTNGWIASLALHADGMTIYAGTWAGVFKSTNGGVNWAPVNNGISSSNLMVRKMAMLEDGQTLFVSTRNTNNINGALYKSTDGGGNWRIVDLGPGSENYKPYGIAVSRDGRTIYVGLTEKGMIRSTDGGLTWVDVSAGLNGSTFYPGTLAVQGDGQTVYVSNVEYTDIYRSTDGGAHWTPIPIAGQPAAYQLKLSPDDRNLYAATSKGVFKSTDGGTQWSAVGGVTNPEYIDSLALDPQSGQVMYAGGSGVVYRNTGVPGNQASLTAEELMNWAQSSLPDFFPGALNTVSGNGFVFRGPYANGNFVGVADSMVYVMGPVWGSQLVPVGTLDSLVCVVKPAGCGNNP